MEAQTLLPRVDELVMEYLLFRGFTKSFQTFAAERRRDRARGFDVDQILSQLLQAVQTYQVESVLETWKFLGARFFHHLDASYASTLQKLETSLLRLYVVNAVKTGHRDKAADFFKRFANRLHAACPPAEGGDSWARWFALPFIERPEADPYFQVFFSREWLEAFVASFRNFLALVFRSLPLPRLLAVQLSRLHDPTLKMRLKVSQAEVSRLRVANVEAASKIKQLEDAGRQLHAILRMMVQHNFLEHFANSAGLDGSSDGPAGGQGVARGRSQYQGGHLGLSRDQMRELGDLFGVSTTESPASGLRSASEGDLALGPDQLLSEEERASDDAFALDSEPGGPMSPPFSPVPGMGRLAVLEPHLELSDDDGSDPDDVDGSPVYWDQSAGRPDPGLGGPHKLKVSLVREMNLLNDWQPTSSAVAVRSRFSCDGKLLAASQVGQSHVDIWRADEVDLSPSSTLSLHHELTHLSWIDAGDGEQAILSSLRDHSINVWRIGTGELLSTLPGDSGARVSQLICARNGSVAVCLYEYDPDDTLSAANDGERLTQDVRMLAMASGELVSHTVARGGSEISCVTVSDDGRLAVVGTAMGQFRFIRAADRHVEEWAPTADELSGGGPVVGLGLSPDSRTLLTAHALSSEMIEWEVGRVVAELSEDAEAEFEANQPIAVCRYDVGHRQEGADDAQGPVSIRFFGAGDLFVVSDAVHLRLFKRGQRLPIDIAQLDRGMLTDLDWHPTLSMCSTASRDGTVALWEVQELGKPSERKEIGI